MGISAGTGEYLPWIIDRDVPCTSPSHGNNSGAPVARSIQYAYVASGLRCVCDACTPMGAHKLRKHTL